jgi:hypothetical protein
MAFAKDIKSFGHNIGFRIGDRVKVIIEDIDSVDINCDTGIIVGMNVSFVHTIEHRKIVCTIRMDAEFFKKPMFGGIGETFTTDIKNIEWVPCFWDSK